MALKPGCILETLRKLFLKKKYNYLPLPCNCDPTNRPGVQVPAGLKAPIGDKAQCCLGATDKVQRLRLRALGVVNLR